MLSAEVVPPVAAPSLGLGVDDVIPTGNDWLALPDIRAADGAIGSFNVLSKAYRGLLQARGPEGRPLLTPVVAVDGVERALQNLDWTALAFWIPVARTVLAGVEIALTYCAPLETRAVCLHIAAVNRRDVAVSIDIGADLAWGGLDRVTYQPSVLTGTRHVAPTLWVADATTFSYRTDDTRFAWAVLHRGFSAEIGGDAATQTLRLRRGAIRLAPGDRLEAEIILAVGLEEMSAPHNGKVLAERLDRLGIDGVIAATAGALMARTRTTGWDDLDLMMNRNALFSRFFAWGRTLDGEDFVGVTSRSPRYYVAAAYWDRDALLWSFPALLRFDPAAARAALAYALGPQLRNTGTHSRFIDGSVLEDGFQLDAAAAPAIALADYVAATGDIDFAAARAEAVDHLAATLAGARDVATGLYASWQDAQDEYRRHPFLTTANVMTWKAFCGLATVMTALGRPRAAAAFAAEAGRLRRAILSLLLVEIDGHDCFATGWDGADGYLVEDIPPGSLYRLPALGFVAEDDPVFVATRAWLESPAYAYSHHGTAFGVPGSYRLPFSTAWVLADLVRLEATRERALAILTGAAWDGGLVAEGLDPVTGRTQPDGRAFATAAGYVATALCDVFGRSKAGVRASASRRSPRRGPGFSSDRAGS